MFSSWITCLSNVANDIKYTIIETKMDLTSSTRTMVTNNNEVSMYIQQSNVSSRYCINMEGTIIDQSVEDTCANVVNTEK